MTHTADKYYSIRPFSSLGVYQRKHNTISGAQKTCKNRKTCELWFVQKGEVSTDTDSGRKYYPAGTMFCFFRTVDIDKAPMKITPGGEILGCSLGELVDELDDKAVLSWNPDQRELLVPETVSDADVLQKILALFLQIRRRNYTTDPMRFLQNRIDISVFLVLLTQYCRDCARTRLQLAGGKAQDYCAQACTYVQEHLSSPICVSDIADAIGISYSYLRRIFAQQMDLSMIEYINREKMRLAAQLIRTGDCSLTVLGDAVGIPDTKYLSRLFRKHMGMSVTQYKMSAHRDSGMM